MADENEISNQSQIFITSAGYKNTFAYEKLLQFLCESVVRPDESIVLGDTWRIPVYEKLQPRNFIEQLRLDGKSIDCAVKVFRTGKPKLNTTW